MRHLQYARINVVNYLENNVIEKKEVCYGTNLGIVKKNITYVRNNSEDDKPSAETTAQRWLK
jgi:hypothetical protein